MAGLQWALVAGLCVGLGLAVCALGFAPAHPQLAQSLALLTPQTIRVSVSPQDWREKLGTWAGPKLPGGMRLISDKDLRLLGISEGAFLGQKLVYCLIGLSLPSVAAVVAALARVEMAWAVPVVVSLGLGAGAFFLPDLLVRDKATKARREFSRALAAYIDLVALERSCGSGAKQALDTAADVGDSWAFRRLRECLDQATWAGRPPWDGLRDMADDLALPDLGDLADIMRLTGTQGAGVYTILRARAQSMRTAMMSDELAKANETNEKMSVPMSVLGIVFLAILIGPALMGMMTR